MGSAFTVLKWSFCIVLLHVSLAHASNISPSDVYKKTELFRLALLEKDLLDVQLYESEKADYALRHPRHVIQKARECSTLLSRVLQDENIDPPPFPNPKSVREVTPGDVNKAIIHLINEVGELGDISVVAPKVEGIKVPNDVYNNLKRICHALRSEIVPSDVYQVVRAVAKNAESILKARGYDLQIQREKHRGKVPEDVYWKTRAMLGGLKILALNPDFAIPGGVVFSNEVPKGDKITLQDVITLMNDALAETNAIQYALGIREYAVLPEYEAKKTPSDVYGEISYVYEIIQFLLIEEALE